MMITQHLHQRLLVGGLAILALIVAIYYSTSSFFKPIFILLNTGVICLALTEYYQLARNKGFTPPFRWGIGFSILYVLTLTWSLHHSKWSELPTLILLMAMLMLFINLFKHSGASLGNLAIGIFGVAYLTIPLSCALRINYFSSLDFQGDGRFWLGYVLLTSKMTDIGAYFSGKTFGKAKLAPSISPQKTIEGSIGGTICALVASLLFTFFASQFSTFQMSWFQSIWIGLAISLLAQLGDLAESLLKRDAGVKDSSRFPGLGGMLDIVDSVVFTLPLLYLLLQMRIVG